jgi:hypothetical protein
MLEMGSEVTTRMLARAGIVEVLESFEVAGLSLT